MRRRLAAAHAHHSLDVVTIWNGTTTDTKTQAPYAIDRLPARSSSADVM
jgi:hypothetical protein